jgi:hypothetical protein
MGASDGTYGLPRILCDMQAMRETCSVNRVARLMQVAGIKARHKRRRLPGQPVSARTLGGAQSAGASVPGIGPKSEMGG